MVVEDAQLAAVGVVRAEGEALGGGATRDEVVGPGAVEVADRGGREDAVGGELGPPGGRGPVGRIEPVGLWPSEPASAMAPPSPMESEACTPHVGHGVGGRVGDDLVPGEAPRWRVGVVATHRPGSAALPASKYRSPLLGSTDAVESIGGDPGTAMPFSSGCPCPWACRRPASLSAHPCPCPTPDCRVAGVPAQEVVAPSWRSEGVEVALPVADLDGRECRRR